MTVCHFGGKCVLSEYKPFEGRTCNILKDRNCVNISKPWPSHYSLAFFSLSHERLWGAHLERSGLPQAVDMGADPAAGGGVLEVVYHACVDKQGTQASNMDSGIIREHLSVSVL